MKTLFILASACILAIAPATSRAAEVKCCDCCTTGDCVCATCTCCDCAACEACK